MSRYHYIVMMLAILCYSCSSGASEEVAENLYDYNEIDEITVELDVEIGERPGYIPGNLNNIILTEDGSILVADAGNIRLDQYSADGIHVRTIATEGNGPGEVPRGFSIADMGMGKYMVRASGVRYYLSRQENEEFVFGDSFVPQSFSAPRRTLNFARNENEFYGQASSFLFSPGPFEDEFYVQQVVITNQFGEILQDSLQELVYPLAMPFSVPGEQINISTPYNPPDQLKNTGKDDGSYIITKPRDSRIDIYDADHNLSESISVQIKPPEFSDSEMAFAIEKTIPPFYTENYNIPQSSIADLERKLRELGKPGFLNVWAHEDKFLLHLDLGREANEMVVINSDGEPLGKFQLSTMDEIHYFRNNKIYTIHEDPERGYFVRVYNVII